LREHIEHTHRRDAHKTEKKAKSHVFLIGTVPLYRVCSTGLGYGVATIRRLFKIIGLFCKRALYKRLDSAKETRNFKEPTNCSHPIDLGFTKEGIACFSSGGGSAGCPKRTRGEQEGIEKIKTHKTHK